MSTLRIHQRGLTLLEVLVSIGILASITAGIVALTNQQSSDTRASVTALHLKTVGDAAKEYIKDNYSTLTAIATATQPALIPVSYLTGSGYLNTGYNPVNPRGQMTCILVLQPTANNLVGMLVTEGGDTIDDLTLGQIAATVGGSGGGIYSSTAGNFTGAMGGWSMPFGNFANPNNLGKKCDGTTAGAITLAAGHPVMALYFNDGTSVSATLYRDAVPGNPSLNTMNTPLIMASVQTLGSACTTNAAIAADSNGAVLSCQGGTWKSQGSAYWQDPVANSASLPTCNASSAWQTRVVKAPTTGAGPRAYTCDGAAWQALAIDDSGNLTIPNNLTVGQTATINKLSGNLQVTATAAEGGACTGEGRIASSTTTSGLILSCQSGSWKKAQGSSGSIGGFTFKINDYSWLLFYGVGSYNSSTGTFSGDLMCDPATVNTSCGTDGRIWCGSSGFCACSNAGVCDYWQWYWNFLNYNKYTVGVSALPVNTVTAKW
jgi:prepilin-type N-terminal cleavage/methylation domain-containing protein